MRSVIRARVGAVTAATSVIAGAALVVPPPALAGPNAWTQISSGATLRNIDEPAVARVGTNLHAVWQQEGADRKASLRTRVIAGNGVPGAAIGSVVSGWDAVIANPAITASAGKPVVVFSGLRPGWQGQLKSATSANGVNWTEGTVALAQNNSAYASYGTAAVEDAGTLVVATNGSGSAVHANRGTPPAPADISNDQRGSAIDVALARDRATGVVWSAWHTLSNPSDPIGTKGIGVQPLYPTVGARSKAPGSTDAVGNAISSDQRIALAARNAPDGGVWVAYAVGYPTAQSIRLWKVGTSIARTIRVGGQVRNVSLSAGHGGRMWLAWRDQNSGKLHATRTDAAVTTFGAVVTVAPPARRGGDTTVWNVASNGALGPLDLVITAGTGSGSNIQVWHNQIQAALAVRVAPSGVRSAAGGQVSISVTDAGVAVAGATVRILGRPYLTNAAGVVTVSVPRGTRRGLLPVSATRAGYSAGASALRVS